ncbi:monovalent cation/H+ antiporter subunit A [Ponticoccus sp. SC2-23]|uniref:monovalent cation/H+ antiporter subunit A n=1 Tax=Alexandriicola marinus TaxID=2081710 RepID=UPI000FDA7FD1|nr:monovalent cation/H+ antiporter subunit A [Alexandriicola marinus]MBM1218959.1 monovalent cation/H+ antiporter subunit A [Ponticoccus sp. SC6-9]MBM1223969.1 monovalent cation/H+ antiporter subunit A [Ponticoccus sp. SC6-15]MBM1230252.1 monovalent cation/H+ antiporter subunit A [Ponticoccus sp. SC6-38]MBM1232935.1 monovalent cation/H+ antiporter subunit A [Ponticoccus sp. SC6-45]MBM1237115.1 monovalent cation/H+ antiporter subunit A [Ponticoccus sp. SC6-49]MBM1241946.1 monovalent cation/H+ 
MTDSSNFLVIIALLPFLGALLPGVMIRAGRTACAWFTAFPTALALLLLLVLAPAVMRGETIHAEIEWLPQLGLTASFMLDGLSLLFAGMILGIGLLITLYARFYLSGNDPMGVFFTYLLLFQGAMLGIVLSDNILLLLIFWELTSLSSFLLIGFWSHLPEGRQGARMALAVTGAGGLAMIGGMLILGDIAGSYKISEILQAGDAIRASDWYIPALILILLGAFTKSAQFPFHFWLPHAMAAPTPVSAYLHSATMVKAGVFLMARMWPALAGTDAWFYIVATTGLVTMVIGALIALFKDDLKALLAFSTVSHLGLLTMLLGIGTPFAAVVAVFHIINHLTFKAALFMTAGIIDHETGTRDINRLGGLRRLMPVTFVIGTIAALSMAGIPLFNGFLSKEMMLDAAHDTTWAGNPLIVAVLATVGALLSVAYSLRFIWHVFFGPVRDDYPSKPHDPPFGMWAGPAFLATLVVVIGIVPAAIVGPLVAVAGGAVIGDAEMPYYSLKIWHGVNAALFMSIIAVVGGLVFLALHGGLNRIWNALPRPEAKAIFDWIVAQVAALSRRVTEASHNGSISRYLAILIVASVALGAVAFGGSGLATPSREMLPVSLPVLAGWLMLIVATGSIVVMHHHRFRALVLIGIIGLMISFGFVFLSAPDLALTQISVETVTIMLLLLALHFMPKSTPRESSGLLKLRDGVIAIAAGGGVGALAYAFMLRDVDTISGYHLENSYTGGGGTNVVNVILVDFRGYDTYGEIIVLGIAGFVIYALMDTLLNGPAARRLRNTDYAQNRSRDRHPLMMVVATRVMMPIAVMVGVYIFLRGHNQPGGGFVAGLVISIALLMQYMASGFAWTQNRQRVEYHALIGIGALVAGLTGAAAWLYNSPFLTSLYGYVELPPIEEFGIGTAFLFDLGVFMTVLGAVMLMLYSLSRIARYAGEPINVDPMDYDPKQAIVDEKGEV